MTKKIQKSVVTSIVNPTESYYPYLLEQPSVDIFKRSGPNTGLYSTEPVNFLVILNHKMLTEVIFICQCLAFYSKLLLIYWVIIA